MWFLKTVADLDAAVARVTGVDLAALAKASAAVARAYRPIPVQPAAKAYIDLDRRVRALEARRA